MNINWKYENYAFQGFIPLKNVIRGNLKGEDSTQSQACVNAQLHL